MPHRVLSSGEAGDSGFTVLEMLVALAILVGIVLLALPALQRTEARFASERAVAAIVQSLEKGRADAQRSNMIVVVRPAVPTSATTAGQYPAFTFRPDGTGFGARIQTGAHADPGADTRIIDLDPLTARPRVYAPR
ncbi:MAG: Tfp pilus assembly protein FimT/FimU [Hyphomicrobiaceae bacterium]